MIPTFWKNVLLFGPILLLWSLLLLVAARRGATPVLYAPAIQAIPSGPLVLATADLRSPRSSALRALFGGDEPSFQKDLRAACNADPLAGAAELALAMPAAAGDGEFGLVIAGTLQASALVGCASQVVQRRGGRPVVLRDGDFFLVSDVASASEGVLAVREGGPLLFGGTPYVRRMMATFHRREPSVELDARHVALRGEVGEGALVVSVLPSSDLRERFREEIGGLQAPLGGVLGVAVSLGPEEAASLRAVVGCASEQACAGVSGEVRKLLQEGTASWIPGLRPVFEGAVVEQVGPTVRLRTALPASLVAALGAGVRSMLGSP